MKFSKKLLNRLRREAGGNPCSKPPKPRRTRRGGFIRSFLAAFAVALTLPTWLIIAHGATGKPRENNVAMTGYSAAALFNQANAYAREAKPGLAVLNYRRAQLLAPYDADIAANLHFVRAKAGLPDAPENWFIHSLDYARPNTLAWLGSFGLLLAGTSLLLLRIYPQRRLAFHSLTFAGALLVVTAMASAVTVWPRVNEAVVTAHDAAARTSPVLAAEPAFKLREGETVTVHAAHQQFFLVKTSAGRSGWVLRTELARVVPQSSASSQSAQRLIHSQLS